MNHCQFITFTDATAIGAATLSSIGIFQAPLPYAFDALEPFISSTLLKEHFTLYHQPHAVALESPLTPQQSIVECLATHLNWINRRLLNLRTATQHSGGARTLAMRLCNIRDLVREHGGGHVNHSLFWKWMAPPALSPVSPVGALASSIESTFGSFVDFKITFTHAALSIPADGWAWLIMRADRKLAITTTRAEENPLMRGVVHDDQLGIPVLGIDMAVHAYAGQYQDNREDYIHAWWHVVNWNQVAKDFDSFADYSNLLATPPHDVLWGRQQ